jgi:hypothetical protein
VKKLLDSLRNKAASGDSDLKYAVGGCDQIGPDNNQTIYMVMFNAHLICLELCVMIV